MLDADRVECFPCGKGAADNTRDDADLAIDQLNRRIQHGHQREEVLQQRLAELELALVRERERSATYREEREASRDAYQRAVEQQAVMIADEREACAKVVRAIRPVPAQGGAALFLAEKAIRARGAA